MQKYHYIRLLQGLFKLLKAPSTIIHGFLDSSGFQNTAAMNKYPQSRPKKGIVWIVNNLESTFKGAKFDTVDIRSAFETVGFVVEKAKTNLRHVEMASLIRDLKIRSFSEFNIFCLVAISRGAAGHFIACEDSPVSPEEAFGLGELVKALQDNRSLSGIPKVLLFEFRAEPRQPDFASSVKNVLGPLDPDFFVGQSTTVFTPDTNKRASIFFNKICRGLRENFRTKSFQEIYQQVQFSTTDAGPLSLKTPVLTSTLLKDISLNDFGKLSRY